MALRLKLEKVVNSSCLAVGCSFQMRKTQNKSNYELDQTYTYKDYIVFSSLG